MGSKVQGLTTSSFIIRAPKSQKGTKKEEEVSTVKGKVRLLGAEKTKQLRPMSGEPGAHEHEEGKKSCLA